MVWLHGWWFVSFAFLRSTQIPDFFEAFLLVFLFRSTCCNGCMTWWCGVVCSFIYLYIFLHQLMLKTCSLKTEQHVWEKQHGCEYPVWKHSLNLVARTHRWMDAVKKGMRDKPSTLLLVICFLSVTISVGAIFCCSGAHGFLFWQLAMCSAVITVLLRPPCYSIC